MTSQDNTKRTRPHRYIESLLDKNQISYETEHDEFPPYCLDLYLPLVHCGIEVDGPGHSRKKDRERDAALRDVYGVPVLHLVAGYRDEAILMTMIEDFILENISTTKERKRAWMSNSSER